MAKNEGAKLEETCGWCKSPVNQGAHICKNCGALRTYERHGVGVFLGSVLMWGSGFIFVYCGLWFLNTTNPAEISVIWRLFSKTTPVMLIGCLLFFKKKKIITWHLRQ